MKDAVVEAKKYTNVVADIEVSVDGTSQFLLTPETLLTWRY